MKKQACSISNKAFGNFVCIAAFDKMPKQDVFWQWSKYVWKWRWRRSPASAAMIKNDQEVISSKLTNLSFNDKISHCIVIDRSSMKLSKACKSAVPWWCKLHCRRKSTKRCLLSSKAWSSNEEISSCSGFERMVQIDWYLKARRSTQKEENSLKQNEFM